MKAIEVLQYLEEIQTDSEISGASDDSFNDENIIPKGENNESNSEDEDIPQANDTHIVAPQGDRGDNEEHFEDATFVPEPVAAIRVRMDMGVNNAMKGAKLFD